MEKVSITNFAPDCDMIMVTIGGIMVTIDRCGDERGKEIVRVVVDNGDDQNTLILGEET